MRIGPDTPRAAARIDLGGEPCPALSVALDDNDAGAIWRLVIYATRPEGGPVLVGTVITRPWKSSGRRRRVVAVARVPGAVAWSVEPERLVVADYADLTLAVDACSTACDGPVLEVPGEDALDLDDGTDLLTAGADVDLLALTGGAPVVQWAAVTAGTLVAVTLRGNTRTWTNLAAGEMSDVAITHVLAGTTSGLRLRLGWRAR